MMDVNKSVARKRWGGRGIAAASLFGVIAISAGSGGAEGTAVPFYFANGTALDAQVSTLIVAVNEDGGGAAVTGDRRRLAMGIDPGMMGNAGIRNFKFQKSGVGFVGSGVMSALDKPGMILVEPLER
jgi:hypothetical protein